MTQSDFIEHMNSMPFFKPLNGLLGCVECPNCKRPFYPRSSNSAGEYCPECWKAWGKADGSFEAVSRTREKESLEMTALRDMNENPSQCPVCEGPMKDWQSASPFEWQPIETAPRDGTQFLALLSNGWYELLRDRSEKDWPYQWWTATGNVSVPIVETHPADTDWSQTFTVLATHWMPLPVAPHP